jgi:hypothetical protein
MRRTFVRDLTYRRLTFVEGPQKEALMPYGAKLAACSAVLLVVALAGPGIVAAQTEIVVPNPVLVFLGQEFYEAGGKQWTRYRYSVVNADAYPNDLFTPAPGLPPCGANTNASRTWVDIFDRANKRIYGFCALGSNTNLGELWFALEPDVLPPSWIYIEINDRQSDMQYRSNEAETTM